MAFTTHSVTSHSLVVFIFLLHTSEITGKCFGRTYQFRDKCYIFAKPVHIAFIRLMRWAEKDLSHEAAQVVESKKMAEQLCRDVAQVGWDKSMEYAEDEIHEAGNISLLGGAGSNLTAAIRITLARPRDAETLQWLQGQFFTHSNLQFTPRSFLNINSNEDKFWNASLNVTDKYNKGVWGFLTSDAYNALLRPSLQGLTFVDGEKPYAQAGLDEFKSRNVICEYNDLADCQWIPVSTYPEDKCVIAWGLSECALVKYAYKKPGHRLGKQCPPHKNHTIPCPDYRKSECEQDCIWSNWTFHKSVCNEGGRGLEFYKRQKLNESFPKSRACPGNMLDARPYKCAGHGNGFSSRFGAAMGMLLCFSVFK